MYSYNNTNDENEKNNKIYEDEDEDQDNGKEQNEDKIQNDNTCHELKNIKYKSMLLNGINSELIVPNKIKNNINIDSILNEERKLNLKEPWSKLDKTIKLIKLQEYVDNYIKVNNKLSENEYNSLHNYLINSLDQKKLHKVKDVIYNINTCKIESIPNLYFNEITRKFTLKRSEKRQSITKSLGPKTRKKNNKKETDTD